MGIFVLPDKNYVQGGLNKKMGILHQYCVMKICRQNKVKSKVLKEMFILQEKIVQELSLF